MKKNIRSGFYDDGEVHGTENWNGKDNNWLGVPGIRMIWYGEWSDPELECNGYVANYWDVENTLYEYAQDDGVNVENDDDFAQYVRDNADAAKDLIEQYGEKQIDSGCHNKKKKGKKPVKSAMPGREKSIRAIMDEYGCSWEEAEEIMNEGIESSKKPIKSSFSESFDNDVLFLVVDINGLSSYAGAESEFTKGEILTYDELFWNIKNGSESINGYCDADLIEGNAFGPGSVEADVRLTFMGMNPSEDEEDDDYIEDCEIKLRIIPSYQYAVKIINGLNEDIMNS